MSQGLHKALSSDQMNRGKSPGRLTGLFSLIKSSEAASNLYFLKTPNPLALIMEWL